MPCFWQGLCAHFFAVAAGYHAPFESTVVRRLRESGAIILGKNNMDEFSMGSSTIHSAFGPARNPIDEELTPGGSSGGTAGAVASGCAVVGLGTDTGGSVRQPAAMCGIVGFKPTYGAISRYGLIAMASSLDTVGLLARSVEDVRIVFDLIRGPDEFDSTADEEAPSASAATGSGQDLVVGISEDFYPEEMEDNVAQCWGEAVRFLAGDKVQKLSFKHVKESLPCYYVIASAEAASNLARYDGIRFGHRSAQSESLSELYRNSREEGFGSEVKRRIAMGNFVLSRTHSSEFFVKAQKVRRLICNDFQSAFSKVKISHPFSQSLYFLFLVPCDGDSDSCAEQTKIY